MQIGCDIVEVKRIEKIINKDLFIAKIFSEAEILYCETLHNKAQSYAARFAAKEAFAKALGTGLYVNGVNPRDVWIEKQESGRPYICMTEKVKQIFNLAGFNKCDISLSHQKDYAIATIIIY